MRSIYIVTHPEATHVTENLVGGWYDSSLTERGIRDATRTAQYLAEWIPEKEQVHLVTSDLRRAQQTAEPIARTFRVSAVIDPDLRERCYGEAEGTPPGTTLFLPPPKGPGRMDHHPGTPGTETRREWATRAYHAIDRVERAGFRESIIVTHGGTLTYLISAWIRLPLDDAGYVKFSSTPGSITHLREDEATQDRCVVIVSHRGHLDGAY